MSEYNVRFEMLAQIRSDEGEYPGSHLGRLSMQKESTLPFVPFLGLVFTDLFDGYVMSVHGVSWDSRKSMFICDIGEPIIFHPQDSREQIRSMFEDGFRIVIDDHEYNSDYPDHGRGQIRVGEKVVWSDPFIIAVLENEGQSFTVIKPHQNQS